MSNNNILVTGAAGFIGSYLCEQLLRDFPESIIVGFDILSYCASKENLSEAALNSRFVFVRGDICNEYFIKDIFRKYNIQTIVHCAAESHVDNSFGNSLHFTEVNVRGTHILLECAKELQQQGKLIRFLHVSTDEVYGTTEESNLHHEGSLLYPTNPYAASKAAAEMYVRAYYKSYQLPIVITRSNNIYGPRQHPEKVVARFVQRVLRGLSPIVHGKLSNERTFLYVTDVAAAISTVLARGKIGETYNIGSDNRLLISKLAEKIVEIAKKEFQITIEQKFETSSEDRPFNDERYRLDWSKVKALGWQPKVEFIEGLTTILHWHNCKNLRHNYWNDSEWLRLVENK